MIRRALARFLRLVFHPSPQDLFLGAFAHATRATRLYGPSDPRTLRALDVALERARQAP